MDWLLNNPQLIIFAVIGTIAFIAKRSQARKQEQQKNAHEQRHRPTQSGSNAHPQANSRTFDASTMEVTEAERTRRIQEDIRRKILARMGGEPAQAEAQTARASATVERRKKQAGAIVPPPLPSRQTDAAWQEDDNEVARRQRRLAEQIRELEAQHAATAAAKPADAFALEPASSNSSTLSKSAFDIYDPQALRQALVMSEILGKPVGLR